MTYILEALLFSSGSTPLDAPHVVELPNALTMMPITGVNREWAGDGDHPTVGGDVLGFIDLSEPIVRVAETASVRGRVCYVHSVFWGGTGFHAAVGWHGGTIAFGPEFTATHEAERQTDQYEVVPLEHNAINRALRFLGVEGEGIDEFATVDLGRHRRTEDW